MQEEEEKKVDNIEIAREDYMEIRNLAQEAYEILSLARREFDEDQNLNTCIDGVLRIMCVQDEVIRKYF